MQLSGKKILLTGASGGIGSALAKALAQKSCRLLLVARDESKLQSLAANIRQQVGDNLTIDIFVCDLNLLEQRRRLLRLHPDVDVLLNLAGGNCFSPLDEMGAAKIEQIISTNVTATISLTALYLPALKLRPQAQIINIGSVFGAIAYPAYSVYSASKFAIRGFTQALRRELSDTNICVLYVAPRATQTNMNSMSAQRLNQQLGNNVDSPDWVAQQIVKVMQTEKTSTTLGWPEKLFAIINQILPGLVDMSINSQLSTIKNTSSNQNTQTLTRGEQL